jgi:hypothetical protein
MQTNPNFKQTAPVGVAGSFFNQLMSNNQSVPVEGEWATIMSHTDRSVVKCVKVSADSKRATVESMNTTADVPEGETLPTGHQCWRHEPTGQKYDIVWKWGGWKVESNPIKWCKSYIEKLRDEQNKDFPIIPDDVREQVFGDHVHMRNVIEGITERRKEYRSINIIWGVCDYYYDWEF